MTLLPEQFAELEPFAAKWCLATETERYDQRMASSIDDMRAFYDAVFGRAREAMDYCDRYPLEDPPEDVRNLLRLLLSLVMVSFPVEVWHQPRMPDSGDAYLERFVEPTV